MRSLITLSAIAFGAVCVVFVGGYFEDTFRKMKESYIKAHTGHLQVFKKGFTEHGRKEPLNYLMDDVDQTLAEIRNVPGVVLATPRIEFMSLISAGQTSYPCIVQGLVPSTLSAPLWNENMGVRALANLFKDTGTLLDQGQSLDEAEPYGAFVGRGLATSIGIKPGSPLVLMASTVGGSLNALDLNTRGIFKTSSMPFDDRVVRLPLVTAQSLLNTEKVQSIFIMLQDTELTDQTKNNFEKKFAEKGWEFEVKTWRDLNDFYTKTELLFNQMFVVLKFVVALIIILSIYNTMNTSVLERITEIGTVMALGAKRNKIIHMFLAEGFLLGIIGGLAGLLIGTVFTLIVAKIGIVMPPPPGAAMSWLSEPMVVPSVLLQAFLLSLVTSLLSSYLPGRRASRFDIADALRHVN